MKQIRIFSLYLLNFKGIREMTVDMSAREVVISGRNGSGKSTIFDAFTWLLFGKDSQGRETFDYKTLDEDGKPIPKLPHEVSGTLDVDGETITLTRRMTEQWVKHRGDIEPKFEGNTCERLYNNVPCSESEFRAKIAAICSEELFKQITSPAYFVTQDWEKQKAALVAMANVTDEDVAAADPQFEELVKTLANKTQTEYSRELAAKKKGINKDLTNIPSRIDENERTIAAMTGEATDWDALPGQLESKSRELEEVENQIMDAAKRDDAANNARRAIYDEINDLRDDIARREREIRDEANRSYNEQLTQFRKLQNDVRLIDGDISSLQRQAEALTRDHTAATAHVDALRSEYTALRIKGKEILARTLVMPESEFICPTCKRTLEYEDIEAKSEELRNNFNAKKESDLADNRAALDDNKKKGIATVGRLKEIDAKQSKIQADIETKQAEKERITSSPDYKEPMPPAEPKEAIASDARIVELNTKIEELKGQITTSDKRDDSALIQQRAALATEVDTLKSRLQKRQTIEERIDRNKQLATQLSALNQELTSIEKIENQIAEFSKAKGRLTKQRIAGLFRLVKFRYVELQINGKEKETCEATLNGKPYRTCSTAEKILIGLDIINTICNYRGVAAPVVIDNAESVNVFPDTAGQRILLRVTDEDSLTVKRNDLLF